MKTPPARQCPGAVLIPALISLFLYLPASAQLISETVDFDTYVSASDNDFQNRFDGGTTLSQILNNGITGGCLETPQTVSWGNDNAVYCTRLKGAAGVTYIQGICFKYDTSEINIINFDRAATLWMKPSADPNHYLIASIINTPEIQVISYSAIGFSGTLNLLHDHWYNLLMSADFTGGGAGDQIDVNAQLNDLGISGTDPPLPAGFTNITLHDSILFADSVIDVSITGTLWGGTRYLDNFRCDGMKSFDNCISTDVNKIGPAEEFSMALENNTLSVYASHENRGSEVSIFSSTGEKIFSEKIESGVTSFNLQEVASGIYFVSISGLAAKKLMVIQQH